MNPAKHSGTPDASPVESKARRRSAAVVLGLTLLGVTGAAADFGFWPSDRASALEDSVAGAERRLADLETSRKTAEAAIAALEAKRSETESAIADASKRVASLDARRETLTRQVAELTGPISNGADDPALDEANAPAPVPLPTERGAALDDPSPPDAEPADRSTASVDGADDPDIATAAPAAAAPEAKLLPAATTASGPVRVFIHVRSADPAARERALAVAAELKRRGVEVAQIRGVRLPIRRDAVRFFYDADREAVTALEQAVRDASSPGAETPQAQDFRSYRAAPRQGTLELWLS